MTAAPETVTFGCRLNLGESEIMQRHAAAAGLNDAIIINTCAVTAEAERQAGQAIRKAKREHPEKRVIVTGCAAQINPQKYRAMPEIDAVIGNDVKLLPQSFHALASPGAENPTPPLLAPDRNPAMQRAFVQVQNGCDHRCTFCIIPYGRGASRSLSVEDIIAQVAQRVDEGFREIVLTGVDIASYGRDLADRPTLGAMMKALFRAVPTLPRLRLSSLDPAAIDEDLWELIAHEPRLMPHLHLSLQAGDDMILKRMKRRHNRADIFRLCDRARAARSDIVFGADIIAGFPTESDAMFDHTFALVEQCALTWLHVFPYSARTETPAAKMPQVHGVTRKARAEKLRQLGDRAAQKHYQTLVGATISVLVENNGVGCTPHFAKIKLRGNAPVGEIVDARCAAMNDEVVGHV